MNRLYAISDDKNNQVAQKHLAFLKKVPRNCRVFTGLVGETLQLRIIHVWLFLDFTRQLLNRLLQLGVFRLKWT